jgi:hypothetical protein
MSNNLNVDMLIEADTDVDDPRNAETDTDDDTVAQIGGDGRSSGLVAVHLGGDEEAGEYTLKKDGFAFITKQAVPVEIIDLCSPAVVASQSLPSTAIGLGGMGGIRSELFLRSRMQPNFLRATTF